MWRIVVLAVVLAHAAAGSAAAQAAAPPQRGELIRVSTTALYGKYEVIEWTTPNLIVWDRRAKEIMPIPVESIHQVAVRDGLEPRSRSFARGLGIGFLVGMSAGALIGYADGDDESGWFSMTAEEKAAMAGAVLGLGGAVVGGLIGVSNPRARWEPVAPPGRVEVIPPGRDGAGVRLSLGV